MLIIRELLIGLLFAVVLQVVNAAGGCWSNAFMSMGLGMAQTVDPNMAECQCLLFWLLCRP